MFLSSSRAPFPESVSVSFLFNCESLRCMELTRVWVLTCVNTDPHFSMFNSFFCAMSFTADCQRNFASFEPPPALVISNAPLFFTAFSGIGDTGGCGTAELLPLSSSSSLSAFLASIGFGLLLDDAMFFKVARKFSIELVFILNIDSVEPVLLTAFIFFSSFAFLS